MYGGQSSEGFLVGHRLQLQVISDRFIALSAPVVIG